eukprot:gb/GECG01007124.1/.p1 GENE.gb/GECG01007124.1/~~gb/GECG01007124.1/.p1  ORF type:complete len:171 (+),score=17.38 gb/GECG01007124.1/:1-513(+)
MGTNTPSNVDLDRYCTTPYVRHEDSGQPPATIEEEKSVWDCCWCCCPCFFKEKSTPPRHCTEQTKVDLDNTTMRSQDNSNGEPDVVQTNLSPMWWKKQQQQYSTQGMTDTPSLTETGTPDVRAISTDSRPPPSRPPRDIPVNGRNRTPRRDHIDVQEYSRTPDPGENRFA